MSEANKPFVVNDRRKFTMDGELRPDAEPSRNDDVEVIPSATPEPLERDPGIAAVEFESEAPTDQQPDLKAPTAEQTEQSRVAYEATAERLDTAIRSANPGMDHPPAMSFEQLVQSVYMTAIMQLGGATPEDQQPRVDLLGARQSIDMLGVLSQKTVGNLRDEEKRLLESALFDARLAFLEVTQALARSAASKAAPPPPNRPSIVR